MAEPRLTENPRASTYWTPPSDAGTSGYGNSTAAVVAGAVLLLFGALVTFGAAIALFGSRMLDPLLPPGRDGDFFQSVFTVAAVTFLAVGIIQVLAAIGIWRHRSWGRFLGIILSALWLALGLLILIGSFGARGTMPANGTTGDISSSIGSSLGLIVVYGFVLLALLLGGKHFERGQMPWTSGAPR